MADTFTNILLHIVFGTKHRQPFVDAELAERLYPYLGGMIRERGGALLEIGGMPDHVHILVRWNTSAVADMMREAKSESTKWVRATFEGREQFQWQTGGGIFSVSQSQARRVVQYIRNQQEHHAKSDFHTEYVRFLKANGIAYDERNLFD